MSYNFGVIPIACVATYAVALRLMVKLPAVLSTTIFYGGNFDFEPYGAAPKSLSEKTYENQPNSGSENNRCEFFVDYGIIWKLGIMPDLMSKVRNK